MPAIDSTRPAAAATGLVFVEVHLFHLVDLAAPMAGGPDRDAEPPLPRGRLVTVAPGTQGRSTLLATFHSELEDNPTHVVLQHWPAEPAEPHGEWESSARELIAVHGGQLTFASGVSTITASHRLTLTPGRYQLDVRCRGRQQARAAELAALDAGMTTPSGVERWLVRLWPDQP